MDDCINPKREELEELVSEEKAISEKERNKEEGARHNECGGIQLSQLLELVMRLEILLFYCK